MRGAILFDLGLVLVTINAQKRQRSHQPLISEAPNTYCRIATLTKSAASTVSELNTKIASVSTHTVYSFEYNKKYYNITMDKN
jgi:hypothetical protein